MTPAIDNLRSPLPPTLASNRRWRSRARLALAVIASLALHWLLQQGLARTVIAVRPLDGMLAEREPSYRPELASDFPLHDETATREAFAHERPLDVPIAIDAAAPASARGPLREGERAVAEGAVAEEAEAPDVAASRIDRPVFDTPVPGPAALGDAERSGAEMPAGSAAAETLPAVVGSDAADAPAAARRERSSASDEPAVDPEFSRGRAVIDPPETVPSGEPIAVISPRRFARAAPGADAPPALPRSLRRTDVAEPGAGGETARVELPARGAAGMAGEERAASAGPQREGAGADLPAGPRPRSAGRIPDRGRGSSAVARRGGAATGAEEETLSAAATAPGAASESALRPRTKPLVGATDVAGPAALATPMRRAGTLLLPAETRVRETAGAFARRWRENRGESPADALVERGLEWLVAAQKEDGRWVLGAYHPEGAGGAVRLRSDTAATGLALLAFLGAGYDHFDGRHRDVVRRGLEWLVSVQQANGDLFVPSDPVSNSCAWLYSHGIATMALCEAVGMTGDPLLRPAAERAIGFIVASQQPGRGGWRYQPRADSDLSVSGWMLVALRAGTLAGLSVPAETYAGVRGLLDESASPDRAGHYLYNARNPGQRPSDLSAASMTALGSLMRLHTGTPRTDEQLRAAAGDLAAMTPAYGTRQARTRDAYLWYYSSQVLVQTGGPQWDAWYGRLCTVLESEQVGDGDDAGSWEPLGTVPDRWGAFGGRLYVTALHLLALEVPYRHLPTYGVTDDDRR